MALIDKLVHHRGRVRGFRRVLLSPKGALRVASERKRHLGTSIGDKALAPRLGVWTGLHEQVRVGVAHQDGARHSLISVLDAIDIGFSELVNEAARILVDRGALRVYDLATANHYDMIVSESFFALSSGVIV